MDKRKDLRNYYQNEINSQLEAKQFADRTAQIDAIETTIVNAFNSLIRYLNGSVSKTEVVNQIQSIETPDVQNVVDAVLKLAKDVQSINFDTKPLIDAINGVKREITLIPSKMPKNPEKKDQESIKISNLSEIDFSQIEKAIKNIEFKSEPKVEVKAPIVNVEKPDLEPIKTGLLNVVKAIKDIKYPELPKTDLSTLEKEAKDTNKKLDEANKHLKMIVDKPSGGGGGGGNGSPYVDSTGKITNVELINGKVPVDVDMVTEGIATSEKQDLVLSELEKKTEPSDIQNTELIILFRQLLLAVQNPPYLDKSANAIRNQVQSGTVTTVTTVTNLTNFGTQSADVLFRLESQNMWSNNVRRLIS